jgi:hypothetical protein
LCIADWDCCIDGRFHPLPLLARKGGWFVKRKFWLNENIFGRFGLIDLVKSSSIGFS